MTITVIIIAVAYIIGYVAYEIVKCTYASKNEELSCSIEFKHIIIAAKACCKLRRLFFANRDMYVLKKLSIDNEDGKYIVDVKYSTLSRHAKHIDFHAVLAPLLKNDEDDV